MLKSVLNVGRAIPVKLEPLIQLETRYANAKAWTDRAAKLLLKKNTTSLLLEVSSSILLYCGHHYSLIPSHSCTCSYTITHVILQSILLRTRASFPHKHSSKPCKKKSESDTVPPGNVLADLGGDETKELEKIRSMKKKELQYMRELRAENSQKVERDEELKSTGMATSPVLYCFCRRPESGYMLQCELCNEWYHASCLHLPKGRQGSVEKDSRYVCNLCVRIRRPMLDGLVSLLISLKKVPVVITEGLALQCLVERAIAWQKRARGFIVGGGGGWSGDGEAAADEDGGAEGQHQMMEGGGRV